LSPITEVNSPYSDVNNSRTDYFDDDKNLARQFASREDLDFIAPTPTTATTTEDNMTSKYSKSMDAIHSSQRPADKPQLTKGVAVNSMIKRLSIERFSPPPQILQAGGFSYTNPSTTTSSPLATTNPKPFNSPPLTKSDQLNSSSDIVYAQVVCNDLKSTVDGRRKVSQNNKQTIHKTANRQKSHSASPPPQPSQQPTTTTNFKSNSHSVDQLRNDTVDNFVSTASPAAAATTNGGTHHYPYKNSIKVITDYDQVDNGTVTTGDEEPIIKPVNIRHHMPRYSSTTIINNQQQQFDNEDEFEQFNEMRDTTDFSSGVDLSLRNRREILESRIKSRIGGLHHSSNNSNNHATHTTTTTFQNHIQRTSSSPPTTATAAAKRYHKYGSNEIIDRYSPERTHLDLVQKSPSPPSPYDRDNRGKNYVDSTLRKKSYYYSKHNKSDRGDDVDTTVVRNNRKNNKFSSRFNIG